MNQLQQLRRRMKALERGRGSQIYFLFGNDPIPDGGPDDTAIIDDIPDANGNADIVYYFKRDTQRGGGDA